MSEQGSQEGATKSENQGDKRIRDLAKDDQGTQESDIERPEKKKRDKRPFKMYYHIYCRF